MAVKQATHVPEGYPDRTLRIRKAGEADRYVLESKYVGTPIDEQGNTYQALGFEPVAEVRDGAEIAYLPRSKGDEVPGADRAHLEAVAVGAAEPEDPSEARKAKRVARELPETQGPTAEAGAIGLPVSRPVGEPSGA